MVVSSNLTASHNKDGSVKRIVYPLGGGSIPPPNTTKGDLQMLIKIVLIQFYCPKCGMTDGKHIRLVGHDITNVIEALAIIPKCPKCNIAVKIDKVICQPWTIPDKSGDNRFGSWVCKAHSDKRYFPLPIKCAAKGDYSGDYAQVGMAELYQTIANRGYPWKCPTCNLPLRYYDDNEIGW
jgi:hypothetical protein